MKVKALLSIILVVFITFTGCDSATPLSEKEDDAVNLIYYTIGNPDKDLDVVNEALNEYLLKTCGFTVQYEKIPWSEYSSEVSSLIGSGNFDILFATGKDQGDYAGNAQNGVWLPLDSFLETSAKTLYDTIDPLFWEGMRINGTIYGVPTNKELSSPEWFIFAKDLVDKYEINPDEYQTFESLEPLLQMIHQNEPDRLPFRLDSEARNYFSLDGYEYIIGREIPLMVKSLDESPQVVNIFETECGQSTIQTIRRFYEKGYINEDAALREPTDLAGSEKLFCTMGSGGPYSDATWSANFGIDVVSTRVSNTVVTTESARGGIMAVNSKTKHPEECLTFLTLVNTDPVVRNLLNFGVENVHYTLDENNQVVSLSTDYAGVSYTQGNWFILYTQAGEPQNKWEIYREFNNSCTRSSLLGFSPDLEELQDITNNVSTVYKKYYASIMTGSVDPDIYIPKMLSELKGAGIDTLKTSLQSQIDNFLAQSNP